MSYSDILSWSSMGELDITFTVFVAILYAQSYIIHEQRYI